MPPGKFINNKISEAKDEIKAILSNNIKISCLISQ